LGFAHPSLCNRASDHHTQKYTLKKMINERVSQAILVSGKSSAGKIESIKKLMWLLTYMGESVDSEERSVEQQVLEIFQSSFRSLWQVKIPRNNTSP
ncbi:hypothetical protein HID58_061124, partial [Brassica napus]